MSWPPRLMGLWAFIDLTINLVEAQKKPTPTRKKGIIYYIYLFIHFGKIYYRFKI
jgi:hypothetical protein